MATSIIERVRKRRENLRASGLRPVQIWIPDTRRPGFVDACHRAAHMVAAADAADRELVAFLDAALEDLVTAHDA